MKRVAYIGLALMTLGLVGCKDSGNSAAAPKQDDAVSATDTKQDVSVATTSTKVTWKSKFPSLWMAAAYAEDVNPEKVTYEQFLNDLTQRLKSDPAFAASVMGPQGPVGPQGPTGAAAPVMGEWEDLLDMSVEYRKKLLPGVYDRNAANYFQEQVLSRNSKITYSDPYDQNKCEYRLVTVGWLSEKPLFDENFERMSGGFPSELIKGDGKVLRFRIGSIGTEGLYREDRELKSNGSTIYLAFSKNSPVHFLMLVDGAKELDIHTGEDYVVADETLDIDSGNLFRPIGRNVLVPELLESYTAGKKFYGRIKVRCLDK